ncbi:MAG: 30S ribosomal protein S6 [Spirochaetes bacterium]|nr:30S ribosomal protein S6 [Spirochaetota bacterium]
MSYELTLILRITDNVESLKELVKKILQKYGVSVISEESWDVKRLAYPIEDETEGYYLFMLIESSPNAIDKIIGEFRLNNDILRYFFIKDNKKKTA